MFRLDVCRPSIRIFLHLLPGAWIVTGGTNAGVMEFVGEAVKEHMLTAGRSEQQVVALGIATWGIVEERHMLMSHDGVSD